MAVIQIKPTSAGRRHMVKVTRDKLHKGEGYAPLLQPQFQHRAHLLRTLVRLREGRPDGAGEALRVLDQLPPRLGPDEEVA